MERDCPPAGSAVPVPCRAGGPALPDRGLIVREPWLSLILSGDKTWELRSSSTSRRGRIALIGSGTGRIAGTAELTGVVGPLSPEELAENVARHHATEKALAAFPYAKTYAWVLERPVRFTEAVVYSHPPGAVIWVKLGR